MASLLSSPAPTNPPPATPRAPRKKSSLISMKREKTRSSKSPDAYYTSDTQYRTVHSLPPVQTHFDRSGNVTNLDTSRGARTSRTPRHTSGSKSSNSLDGTGSPQSVEKKRKGRDQWKPSEESLYNYTDGENLRGDEWRTDDKEATVKASRPRSRTTTSDAIGDWREGRYGSPYRISGSSSQTQMEETPPQTPLDLTFQHNLGRINVVVAAPISGVETMDALVDGMNGFGVDDHFMGVGGISRTKSKKRAHHHPLYHPPLPTPPPGVILGRQSRESDQDDDIPTPPTTPPRNTRSPRRKVRRPSPAREDSSSTITKPSVDIRRSSSFASSPVQSNKSIDEIVNGLSSPMSSINGRRQDSKNKTVVPSITDIIRTHAPLYQQSRSSARPNSRTSSYTHSSQTHSHYSHSNGHTLDTAEEEKGPGPLTAEEEAEFISRSSLDSLTEEIRQTIRTQASSPAAPRHLQHAQSFPDRQSVHSDGGLSIRSPLSDVGRIPSWYSSPTTTANYRAPSPIDSLAEAMKPTQAQKIAQYLHSTRLNTMLKLTRYPHASSDRPLTVSLSDLGNPNGHPLVVFLGLGCVRHVMGLYDEMAELLGLRLITIDRWGLGRTDTPRSKSARGIPEWGSIVEEVLDVLNINQCSVMAHSAGAPYALSFANRAPERIRGDICLLAPWVGGGAGAGYKWLKYVPNGILKTAQQAEWKMQGWMLGKPPKVRYEGIGYSPDTPVARTRSTSSSKGHDGRSIKNESLTAVYPSFENHGRPSTASSNWSEYDDLADFDGRFESRSTLGARQGPALDRTPTKGLGKRKTSRGILGRLRGDTSQPQVQTPDKQTAKSLRTLKSMGSLKSKSLPSSVSKKASSAALESPQLSEPLSLGEMGLGFGEIDWPLEAALQLDDSASPLSTINGDRASRRRSISFTSPNTASFTSSPAPSTYTYHGTDVANRSAEMSYQAALGNALMSASHAESSKGTHSDLLQILNHDHQPWGFSYATYPHRVRVWYGDKDEKIAENAVRWMETAMGEGQCSVKVVEGADHSLMFKSSVVIELLEQVSEYWKDDD